MTAAATDRAHGSQGRGVVELTVTATRSHLVHAATMLRSLCEAAPERALRVHLLHDGPVTATDLRPLRASLEPFPVRVVDVPVPVSLQRRLPSHRFHVSAWFRVLLPRLAPHLDRALHVDVDAVVLEDLATLWETDLQGRLFAAVANPLYPFQPPHWRHDLGLAGPREYPNTGVMLMDLQRMREVELVDRLLAYASTHPDNAWPEQDALATTCRGEWLELHPRWNVQTTLYDLDLGQLPFTSAEVAGALARPAVVHYIGPYKPWTHACHHPLRHLYHHARAATAYGLAMEPPTWRQRVMRRLQEEDRARVALAEHRIRRFLRPLRWR